LIVRKISKIVATSCKILKLKCVKFDLRWGSAPDTAGGAHSAPPDPLAGFKGGEGRRRKGKKGEGKGGGVHLTHFALVNLAALRSMFISTDKAVN